MSPSLTTLSNLDCICLKSNTRSILIFLINLLMIFIFYSIYISIKTASTLKSGLHMHLSFSVAFAKFGVTTVTRGVKIVDRSGMELDDEYLRM